MAIFLSVLQVPGFSWKNRNTPDESAQDQRRPHTRFIIFSVRAHYRPKVKYPVYFIIAWHNWGKLIFFLIMTKLLPICESGGTGIRAGFRILWGNPWGFESPLSHHFRLSLKAFWKIRIKVFCPWRRRDTERGQGSRVNANERCGWGLISERAMRGDVAVTRHDLLLFKQFS